MTLLALTGGDTALIVLAVFWGLLVLFLCVVLLNTFRVLESTKMTIDAFREETVPLLREVEDLGRADEPRARPRRHDARVAPPTSSRGSRSSPGLVEEAASSPLVKVISFGAGLQKGFGKAKGGRKK